MRACFTVADERTFEQDPRFGLCVLTEIASRAASDAVNDTGTAIDILTRLGRVLELYIAERGEESAVEFERIWVPELLADDLFQDAFNPLARDAASVYEVQARLQKTLAHLGSLSGDYRECARKYSAIALQYCDKKMVLEEEREALRKIAGQSGTGESREKAASGEGTG